LASAGAQKEITATMGKGEGVALEADVGFKDIDNKGTFSPHAASHVEETAQVCLSFLYVLCCCNPCIESSGSFFVRLVCISLRRRKLKSRNSSGGDQKYTAKIFTRM